MSKDILNPDHQLGKEISEGRKMAFPGELTKWELETKQSSLQLQNFVFVDSQLIRDQKPI